MHLARRRKALGTMLANIKVDLADVGYGSYRGLERPLALILPVLRWYGCPEITSLPGC
jgi:hypothetical protein